MSPELRSPSYRARARRGGIYFAVVGVAMLVALIGLSAMAAVRVQRLAVDGATDTIKARELARSAVEIGATYVANDSNWRTNRAAGVWASRSLGDGVMTIEGLDTLDASFTNRTTDPLTIRGTGLRGNARQMLEVTLTASGPPIDALTMAVHTAGQFHVRSGRSLTVSGAPASTNGSLRNDGTINGDVECGTFTAIGTINGSFTFAAPSKAMPAASVITMYQNIATPMSAPSVLSGQLVSPASNPWGATNADGVYVITSASDITIRNCRIVGTLVVICPGKKVTIDGPVNIKPARRDYPALVVNGSIDFATDSSQLLYESVPGLNMNPTGVPYEGSTNGTTADSYPNEIAGLVHAKEQVDFRSSFRIRGALIAEASGTEAIDIDAAPEIVYDPTLQTTPIMGYMKSVTMTVVPTSWKQIVGP
jgi:hypothetical protein